MKRAVLVLLVLARAAHAQSDDTKAQARKLLPTPVGPRMNTCS